VRFALFFLAVLLNAADDSFLLRGGTIHPVTGPEIPGGSILVAGGRIVEVGGKVVPPKGARVIDIKGLHVYPGLIDSGTELGLTEISAVAETNDIDELGVFKPQLKALTAVNPASEHIPVTRSNGVTTALIQPGGGVIAGQAALIHLDGWTPAEMALRAPAALCIEFPQILPGPRTGATRTPYSEMKRRYERQVRELDEFFESARGYQHAKAAGRPDFAPDLKLEAMLPAIEGKVPLLIHANRESVIREAIRFAERQKLRMILREGRDAWKLAAELKAKNIPVVLGPSQVLPQEEDDPYDKVFGVPGELVRAGVKIAFATFGPTAEISPRNLPYQASAAVAFGLPYDEALKAVTINPAEIFGVGAETGSIEKGKLADLIVTDGDPLEVRTQVKRAFIGGRAVDLEDKHHRLYERYRARP
jgi:imidazolonepropionase-like amidohydrolase